MSEPKTVAAHNKQLTGDFMAFPNQRGGFPVQMQVKSDTQKILEAIAALRDGLLKRVDEQGVELCEQNGPKGYACCKPMGHKGKHVATIPGGRVLESWAGQRNGRRK